jgi:phenylpropionate dioxygenase-like ring-hydroxylating dioxygenase large terminal subunit
MLNAEQNRELTQVAAGTAMGDLLREFWLPVLLRDEIAADDPPLRTRVLGEDLVAFACADGSVGLVSAYCAHRCAPLWFARNEADGLRCTYHGWKFDTGGRCLEMPNEPPAQRFEAKVRLDAYPTETRAGLVWAYMGTQSPPPPLPEFNWTDLPPGRLHVSRWLQHSNWVQGMEGEIDNSHVPFLHSALDPADNCVLMDGAAVSVFVTRDSTFAVPYPTLMVRRTDSGLLVGSRRELQGGEFHWRVNRWWPPSWSMVGNVTPPFNGRVWVPIDDDHTMTFSYVFHPERDLDDRELAYIASGHAFPPITEPGPYVLPDGYKIDIRTPAANIGNDYLVDRGGQSAGVSYTGIRGLNNQDRSVQEAMRAPAAGRQVVDRSSERLGSADVGAIAARRALLRYARDFRERGALPLVVGRPGAHRGRSLDVLARTADFDELIELHRPDLGEIVLAPAGGSAAGEREAGHS